MFYQKSQKGFTLIELILVVLLIGLLVAIAIPAIFGMRRKYTESDVDNIRTGNLCGYGQGNRADPRGILFN